jgi:drug/metabolite transporter (DMT)-like permease
MAGVGVGEWAAAGTALLWTLSSLAWTSAGRHVGAMSVSFVRLVLTIPMLMVYGLLVRGMSLPADATAETWWILGLSGLLGYFAADLCLFKSFLLIGPRLSLLIQSLTPPIAAVVSWVFLGEALNVRHWLAMAVTLGGIAWVVLERPERGRHPHARRHLRQGIVLSVVAAVAAALGLVLARQGIGDYDAGAATMIRVLGAMPGYAVLLTVLRRWVRIGRSLRHGRAMLIIAFGALVGPCLGVILCMVALRHCHAGVVATIINTMPVLILPFLIVLYHEKVSLRAAGGAVLALAGVALLVL